MLSEQNILKSLLKKNWAVCEEVVGEKKMAVVLPELIFDHVVKVSLRL